MRARRHVPSTTDATGDGLLREVAPTMAFATGVFEVDTMAHVELDYLLCLGASDGLPRSRSIEASRRPRLGPTMAFATGVLRGRNDGSCGAGLLDRSGAGDLPSRTVFRKVRVFLVLTFANHARAPPTRRDA